MALTFANECRKAALDGITALLSGGSVLFTTSGDAALALTAGIYATSNASSNPVGLYIEDGAVITDNGGTALMISSTGNNGDGVEISGHGTGVDLRTDMTGNITGNLVGTVTTVTTLTGHTAQTGDVYALANGATGFTAIDTVVDAIKVKTDSLTFTKALELDANMQSINGTTLVGDGVSPKFGV